MGFPTVEKFLCCCHLKTGVLIIGVLNLIGALLGVLGCGLSLGGLTVVASGVLDDLNLEDQQLQHLNNATTWLGDASEDLLSEDDPQMGYAIAMMVMLTLLCLFYLVTASLLIHGARKGKAGLLVPWMVETFLGLVYDLVQIIGTLVRLEALAVVFGIIGFAVGCYVFVVVWSFRKQLLEVNVENSKA